MTSPKHLDALERSLRREQAAYRQRQQRQLVHLLGQRIQLAREQLTTRR